MGRPKGSWKGAANPRWKGGVRRNQGYVMLLRPDHPNADAAGYVREHVLVMTERLGRPLTPDELVHHENEQRADNRDKNLELMSRPEHATLHHKGRIKPNSLKNLTYVPPKKPLLPVTCQHCGLTFTPKKRRRNPNVFCSVSCSTKHWHSKAR